MQLISISDFLNSFKPFLNKPLQESGRRKGTRANKFLLLRIEKVKPKAK